MSEYSACGSKQLLVIQIDAAINAGNSGGPCFEAESSDGELQRCVGIAFQVLTGDDAENIGYIIPTEVVDHFLEDFARNGKYTGFGCGGFIYQNLENPGMRTALGMKKDESGVMVTSVNPATPAVAVLQPGDVLMGIDGSIIGSDGKVAFQNVSHMRIDLGYVFSRKFVGDSCKISLLRDKKKQDVDLTLARFNLLAPRDVDAPPQYFIYGGCVFVPLTENWLSHEFGEKFDQDAPIRILKYWVSNHKKSEDHQVVVLAQVLASPLTQGFTDMYYLVLQSCNGVEPRNLAHLVSVVEACKSDYVNFTFEGGQCIVLGSKEVQTHGPGVLRDNMIASDRSNHFLQSKKASEMG
eukprot:gnl/MRDRNA2_/MRDRNA2_172285_c0_seq1.p1 gnl/MRDRNA2_/MRDRNA2_172285_c0~~gnl/MRDRNA2_/MRDRNA2_172285_c0_seq1.p1  ORF type:complete len:380 (-),score=63.77 gnl/MRDRNA2_/MRDRNA2_172285_c0_seq1:71-1126(-)